MGLAIVVLLILVISGIIAVLWANGIDYMQKNHPDYKGEDFLNWGNETAPWETNTWDDNKAHTEGGI